MFDRLVDGQRDVFTCDIHGANLRRLTDDPADDVIPRWSADGRSVYFASYRQGGSQIWKLTLDTGQLVRMTTDGGLLAEESPDGRTLYFMPDERSAPVLAMPSGGGAAQRIVDAASFLQMSVTQEGIYYVPADAQTEVRFLDFSSGAHRPVASLPRAVPGPFAADLNHRMLVFAQPGPPPGDLILARGIRLR